MEVREAESGLEEALEARELFEEKPGHGGCGKVRGRMIRRLTFGSHEKKGLSSETCHIFLPVSAQRMLLSGSLDRAFPRGAQPPSL